MASSLKILAAILIAFTTLHVRRAASQNCYYPNGDLSPTDAACSSGGGACCPNGWQCLSNGLCYLGGSQDIYGRYTCTDQTWQSSSCPQICTHGNTATGDEAMLQCADGSWCCDGDRTSGNCCTVADTSFFSLPQGNVFATISSVPSPTSVASLASPNPPPSTSDAIPISTSSQVQTTSSSSSTPSTSASSSAAASSPSTSSTQSQASSSSSSQLPSAGRATSTFTSQALTTASNGVVSTVTMVSVATVAPAVTSASHPSDPSSSSHLGLIIGLAVGIPVFLLACAIIAFIHWKRRKANRGSYISPPRNSYDDPAMNDKYGHQVGHEAPDGRAPELDSYPVAFDRTKNNRHSELEGSNALLHSPTPSTGTAPPQYSQNSPRSPGLHSVQEEPQEPQELWGGYVPYRPPRTELPSEPETSGD